MSAGSRIEIGETADFGVTLDPLVLVDTRALITANSGGGKSWLLRKIAEQVADRIQTIIVDPEGEYKTIREKVDAVLVGEGGELAADPDTAGRLARMFMESHVSAVLDISELEPTAQQAFVRDFIEGLMRAPRELWHPMLIGIDEVHKFCPERGAGESDSTKAVIELLCTGRKRGMGTIIATQRLTKVRNDAASECTNVFVGRTVLDQDQRRAGQALGFSGREEPRKLGKLKPGQFWAHGPALNLDGVERFTVGDVLTSHPSAGGRMNVKAPPASKKIAGLVSAMQSELSTGTADTPSTLEDATARIAELEKKLHGRADLSGPAASRSIAAAVAKALKSRDLEHRAHLDALRTHLIATTAQHSRAMQSAFSDAVVSLFASGTGGGGSTPHPAVAGFAATPPPFINTEQRKALVDAFAPMLSATPRGMFRQLVEAWPAEVSVEALERASGVLNPDTFQRYLRALRQHKLVEGNGAVRAPDALFADPHTEPRS